MDVGLIVVAFGFGFAASLIRLPPLVGYLAASPPRSADVSAAADEPPPPRHHHHHHRRRRSSISISSGIPAAERLARSLERLRAALPPPAPSAAAPVAHGGPAAASGQ